MDNRAEVREFLISRRAKLTPDQTGLPDIGSRRVPGLRRGEVAALAGVSVEYYTKLERGALAGASASVLDAIARALQLDDAERAHLFDLARAADGTSALARPARRTTRGWTPRPALQWALDAYAAGPAIVRNGRMDLLAANHLGRAMHSSMYESDPGRTPNFARYTFLDSDARRFYPDWERAADIAVSILRIEAGRDPHDRGMHDLVGELSTRSDEFRRRWSAHNVRLHGAGTKHFHHRAVGDLTLAYESLELVSEPGLNLTLYSAEPGSPTESALALLASWAATQDADEARRTELPT
ncbi:Helix-turn-helix domain-containing protein [Asanoa hainanensis]|uniref:Helix-turn-helix domain-containing protein n=1 Tax=Asanoa hainanensis TaxID=560556 RepID=A0A239N3A7_9ACTN|nr:helix-turn-helix transcriptional regulator [Asanoa hainanensis]SNT49517.1 Helix-turn-helix domain-containing protein [Asanoa hainanensis]